jgi:hypothetical protein
MKITRGYHGAEGGWIDVEITIAPIGKFIPLHKFDAAWAMFFRREIRHHDTYLMTELRVRKPETVRPDRARVFETELYLFDGEVVDYNGLRDRCEKRRPHKRFAGTSEHESVVLVEVYADHGDDGHIRNELIGYRFVGEKALEDRQAVWGTMSVIMNMPGDHE